MKFSILCVSLATTIFVAGYTNPRNCLAETPEANLKQPQLVLPGQSSTEQTPTEPSDVITLDWTLDAAVNYHPSLAATWYEIEARRGAARQAGLIPNPTLFGEIEELGGSGGFSGTDVMSSRIGISQEIPLGGKIGKSVREAETANRIAYLEHQVQIIDIKVLAERRFFEMFNLQEQLALHEEQLSLIQKGHDVVSKRVKIGDTSPMDLARSQVELASAKIELEQTRKKLDSARYALAESWGSKSPVFSTVSGQYQPAFSYTEKELQEALEHSPAWLLLEEKFSRADAALDLEKAQSTPNIELEGGIQNFNETNDHAFFLGLSIPLPVFDRNQGGVAEAKAMVLKAQHQKKAGFLALSSELKEAWRNLVSTQKAVQSLEMEVIPVAQNAYEAISKAYKAGEVDILALLDAQRIWIETRKTHLDLLQQQEYSRIEIKRLISGGVISSESFAYNIQN